MGLCLDPWKLVFGLRISCLVFDFRPLAVDFMFLGVELGSCQLLTCEKLIWARTVDFRPLEVDNY